MIRLDFPGFSGGESLQPISWDRWFQSFDDNNLALLVQDKTARGGRSNFNKLVTRASRTRRGSSSGSRRRGSVKRTSSASQRHTAAERTTGRKRTSTKRASTRARRSRNQSRRSRGR